MKSFPIYYETHGNSADPCIILIAGLGAQLIHWPENFILLLTTRGFYVVVFDNRDTGLSQYYDHLGNVNINEAITAKQNGLAVDLPYTLSDMANDVIILMDKLSIKKAHIIGMSMGGVIAQIFALEHPSRVISLILIGTTSGDLHLPSSNPEVLEFFASSSKNNEESLASYIESRSKLYRIYSPNFSDEEKTKELHKKAYQRAYHPEGFKRQLLAFIFANPRGEKLKKSKIKSLVIHGEIDPVFPIEHASYLSECIPQSRLKIFPRMGHLLADDLCEDIVNTVVDFIHS